ncbi:hypothetical protein DH2020_023675 [Rehmannia glutinosa]|uniref:Coiled-coil domain-containing protein n=1 Tax=Rehmannia glutinosa TaxID=99300 RepID=A0ABR0W6R8_REHGL
MAKKTGVSVSKADREGQYWDEEEGGAKSRAEKRREEKDERRAEANAKKAEARRLAEQEEMELSRSTTKKKVTQEELQRRREEEYAVMQTRVEEEKRKQSRTASLTAYQRIVDVANTNRDDSVIEARTVEDFIAQMTVVNSLPLDKHPERRLQNSFMAFMEVELQRLKEEKPGLTLSQYRDAILKLWKKSKDNVPFKHPKKFNKRSASSKMINTMLDSDY